MRHRSTRAASIFCRRSSGAAIILPLLLTLLLSACNGPSGAASSQPVTLNVFAAASLQAAFTDIGDAFHTAHPNVTVTFNFGGSDALATQINQGAPADVFASANIKQMNVAVQGGQITSSSVQTFAHNRLVVIYPKNNPAHIATLQDLAKTGVHLVLAAQAVPVGQYALDFLTKASADPSFGASYKDAVLKNVVSYEADVKSVLTKVALGEADAGIVYITDAKTKADSVTTIDIPDALNSIAVYPIAPVKGSQRADVAQQFISAVLSAQGQATLAKYGFVAGSSGPQYTPPAGA
ncbi:MAG: Molybdenum ABC transporter, substrate-binding protein ModA [Ktedonobacterales bacterium]|jgi:molybdate transport system substrate-binding protein|nr:MAG: Molybdenum ABC transporter, substrate-binding protein ModA [Ktedonobacterales bacterium]